MVESLSMCKMFYVLGNVIVISKCSFKMLHISVHTIGTLHIMFTGIYSQVCP